MKHAYPYQFKLLTVLSLSVLFLLQACAPPKPGVYKDDQIPGGKRADFHKLNKDAFDEIKTNNLKIFEQMMSQELIDRPGNDHLMELIGNRLADHPYKVLEEYYVVRAGKGKPDTAAHDSIPASGTDVNRHTIKYTARANEMYLAFLAPEKADSKFLITLVYAKLNYGWKITDMALGQYTCDGMTAPELYKLGKEEYSKKHLVNAVTDMAMAYKCFGPSPLWSYKDTTGAQAFADKVADEGDIKFSKPIDLTEVSSSPRIIAVTTERDGEWVAPSIWYLTHYNLHGDSTRLKKENLEVQKAVAKIFPGIQDTRGYIKFVAFNEKPTNDRSVDRFEMFERLK